MRRRRRRRALRFVGAGVYQLTIRLAVNFVAAVLFVYFLINSATVARHVSASASELVPGSITVRQVQWGPDPGRLRVIRPEVRDPSGNLVLAAEWLYVDISWLGLMTDLVTGQGVRQVRVREVAMAGPRVALEQDDRGRLRMALAFADPDAPADPPQANKQPFALIIEQIKVRGGGVRLDMAGTKIDVKRLNFRGDFKLELPAEGPPRYSYAAHRVSAADGGIWLASFEQSGLAQLPHGRIDLHRLAGDQSKVRCYGIEVVAPHTRITRGDVLVQLDAPLPGGPADARGVDVQVTGAELISSTVEPFLGRMLGELFAAKATVAGDVHVTPAGATHFVGTVSGDGLMSGFQTQSVVSKLKVDVLAKPGEVVRVQADDLEVVAFGGKLSSKTLRYRLDESGDMQTKGVVRAQGVSVGEVLRSKAVGMAGDVVTAMAGTLDGQVETDVSLRIDPGEGGESALTLVAKVGGALTLARATDAKWLRDAVPVLHLRGQIDTLMQPRKTPAAPLTIELGQVLVSDTADKAGHPKRTTKALWAFADGVVDVHRQRLDLRVDGNVPQLAKLLAPFGVKGVKGAMRLEDVGVTGPWLAPTVRGQVTGRNLLAGGQRISRVRTGLHLAAGKLRLDDLRADVALGHISGDLELDLYEGDLTRLRERILLRGEQVRVRGVQVHDLLLPYGIRDVRGVASLSKTHFSVDLSDPVRTATARAHLHIARPTLRHEHLHRLDADVRFGKGRVDILGLELEYRRLKLAGLAPNVTAPTVTVKSIRYVMASHRFTVVDLHWPEMPMSRIGEIAVLKMPLGGSIAADVRRAEGDLNDIAFDADVTLTALRWDQINMRDAVVTLRKERGRPAVVASDPFFDRFTLMGGSKVHFRKLVPMWMQLQMRTRKLDPMAFLGLPPMGGVRMLATGRAEFRLDFRPGQPVFSVVAELPKGGAELDLGNGLDPVANLEPATIKILPDRVNIGSMTLPVGRETLELCGDFLYPDAAKGTPSVLQLYMAGALDVPRFGAIAESMAALDMRLRIEHDALVAVDKRAGCLKTLAAKRGVLRVAGPLDALVPQGRLTLVDGRMTPRGYGHEIVLTPGAKLELSGLPRGKLRVRIPVGSRLDGQVGEGRFSTWGDVELNGYTPANIDWRFDGVDLAHTVPKEYSVVASAQLRFLGSRLLDAKRRQMKLSGKVKVTEGSYSKSFDKLGKVISGAQGRELETYSAPLLERMPWVGDIALDLEVDGTDFLVLSRFPFGKTDLELGLDLKVQGTVAEMRIYDRVEVQPGSILTYSVVKRDFEVTRGTIDFSGDPMKGVLDLEAKSTVELNRDGGTTGYASMSVGPNLSGTSSGATVEKVTVIVRVSGPLNDPSKLNIQLDSIPPYQQGDIQSLILTGQLLNADSQGAVGSHRQISLFTDDIAAAFSEMLLSAFVDKVSFGIPLAGTGITATVQTSLGKYLTLKGSVETGNDSRSVGSFTFMLPFEGLYLESLLMSTQSSDTLKTQNIFEGRIRYRYTVED